MPSGASWKQAVKARWPRLSRALGNAYRSTIGQVLVELSVIRQVGVRRLWRELVRRPSAGAWETELPVQGVQRLRVERIEAVAWDELAAAVRASGVAIAEGTHTIYLSPAAVRMSPFRAVADRYPADAGLKLSKNPGSVDDSSYVYGQHWSEVQKRLINSHRRLSLVANLLAAEDLGPRLYDLIELDAGAAIWTAYVVQHVDGRQPSLTECEEGLGRLMALETSGAIALANTDGFAHQDFQPPACNGNALMSRTGGGFRYIDFQNILLNSYGQRLNRIAAEAMGASHFGQRSLLRGGAYLYQSVPGATL